MSSTDGDPRDISAGLAGLMAQLQTTLGGSIGGSLAGEASGARPPPGQGPGGHGSAAGGAVRVEVSPTGRLESLTIDPSLLRSGVVSVADVVLAAVQAAQDDAARAGAGSAELPGAVDPAAMSEAAEVAQQGMVRFEQMLAELDQVTRRLDGGRP